MPDLSDQVTAAHAGKSRAPRLPRLVQAALHEDGDPVHARDVRPVHAGRQLRLVQMQACLLQRLPSRAGLEGLAQLQLAAGEGPLPAAVRAASAPCAGVGPPAAAPASRAAPGRGKRAPAAAHRLPMSTSPLRLSTSTPHAHPRPAERRGVWPQLGGAPPQATLPAQI